VAILSEGIALAVEPGDLEGLHDAGMDPYGQVRIADMNIGEIRNKGVELSIDHTFDRNWNAFHEDPRFQRYVKAEDAEHLIESVDTVYMHASPYSKLK